MNQTLSERELAELLDAVGFHGGAALHRRRTERDMQATIERLRDEIERLSWTNDELERQLAQARRWVEEREDVIRAMREAVA